MHQTQGSKEQFWMTTYIKVDLGSGVVHMVKAAVVNEGDIVEMATGAAQQRRGGLSDAGLEAI
jgi:hypothetical protein